MEHAPFAWTPESSGADALPKGSISDCGGARFDSADLTGLVQSLGIQLD